MADEYIRKDELANEIVREEILRNQPYYRQKGKRFTENLAGYAMLAKPGPPEVWMRTLPDVQRLDKAQLVMLIEENLIPREDGLQCLRALKEIEKETVSGKMAKEIFAQMTQTGRSASEIISEKGLAQITDEKDLTRIVEEVLTENPENVKMYHAGKEKLFGFFVGQVMKRTQGKADPKLVNEILKAKLTEDKEKT